MYVRMSLGLVCLVLNLSILAQALVAPHKLNRHWLLRGASLHSSTNGFAGGDLRLLYVIPESLVPLQSVVSYIQKWGIDTSSSGGAITSTQKPDGISFFFTPAPGSRLDINVNPTVAGDLSISSRIVLKNANQQASSLVNFAAQNLIDSLSNDIGALIMNVESPTATADTKIKRTKEESRHGVAYSYSGLEEAQEEEVYGDGDEAAENESPQLTEEDLSKFWKVRDITPDEREKLLADAMISKEQEAEIEEAQRRTASAVTAAGKTSPQFSSSRGKFSSNPANNNNIAKAGVKAELTGPGTSSSDISATKSESKKDDFGPDSDVTLPPFSAHSTNAASRVNGGRVATTATGGSIPGNIGNSLSDSASTAGLTRQQMIMQAKAPSTPIEERSPLAEQHSLPQSPHGIKPPSSGMQPLLPSFDASPLVAVSSWPRITVGVDVIKRFVQGWADNFAGRGVGIEADNTDDGVLFSFAISDEFSLRVRVGTVGNSGAQVTAFLSLGAAAGGGGGGGAVGGEEQGQLNGDTTGSSKLVKTAAQNLVGKLSKELSTIMVAESDSLLNDVAPANQYNPATTPIEEEVVPKFFTGSTQQFSASFFGSNPSATAADLGTKEKAAKAVAAAATATSTATSTSSNTAATASTSSSTSASSVGSSSTIIGSLRPATAQTAVSVPGKSILDRNEPITTVTTTTTAPVSSSIPPASVSSTSSSVSPPTTTTAAATTGTTAATTATGTTTTAAIVESQLQPQPPQSQPPQYASAAAATAIPKRGLTLTPDDSLSELNTAFRVIDKASEESARNSLRPASGAAPQRMRDPELVEKARAAGVRVEKFEKVGLEEAALEELRNMVDNSRKEGFLAFIKKVDNASAAATAAKQQGNQFSIGPDGIIDVNPVEEGVSSSSSLFDTDTTGTVPALSMPVKELFEAGTMISNKTWQDMIARRLDRDYEDLSKPPTKLPINLKAGGLAGGIDIFEGPPNLYGEDSRAPESSIIGQLQQQQAGGVLTTKGGEVLTPPPNIDTLESDKGKMAVLLTELNRTDEFMHDNIIDSYRDLLLADNFLYLLRQANRTTGSYRERLLYGKMANKAMAVVAELGALVKTESVRHLQTIHDVCEVAALYQQDELKFLERMDYIKPRFDTALLAYLRYAIQEERDAIRLRGSDPDRLPSTWVQVLSVVQQGVQAEFEARFERLLEPLLLTVRLDGEMDKYTRSDIFARFVSITPAMDLPYLRELALNMISRILSTPEEELPDRSLYTKMKNLQDDVEIYLSEEIVHEQVEQFKSGVKSQGQEMTIRHRNPAVQAELDMKQDDVTGGGGVSESILDPLGRMKKQRAVEDDQVDPELQELGMGFSSGAAAISTTTTTRSGSLIGGGGGIALNNRDIRKIGGGSSGGGGINASTRVVAPYSVVGDSDSSSAATGPRAAAVAAASSDEITAENKAGEEKEEEENKQDNDADGSRSSGGDDDKNSDQGNNSKEGQKGPDKSKGYLLNWG